MIGCQHEHGLRFCKGHRLQLGLNVDIERYDQVKLCFLHHLEHRVIVTGVVVQLNPGVLTTHLNYKARQDETGQCAAAADAHRSDDCSDISADGGSEFGTIGQHLPCDWQDRESIRG